MTLNDLLSALRDDLQDAVKPYLWSDESLTRWLNEAETEACRRSRLIVDSTSAFCTIRFASGVSLAKLDSRIIFVKRAIVTGEVKTLGRVTVRDLDMARPGWEDDTGTPEAVVTDYQAGKVKLDRIPDEDITVRLTVIRVPLNVMESVDSEPEIPARFHENLMHWARFRAYSKHDTETFNEQAAVNALALFESEFGKRSAAIDETWISEQNDFAEYQGVF